MKITAVCALAAIQAANAFQIGGMLRMSDDTINLGVLGAGRIGQVHCKTAAFRIPGAKLIGVADPFEKFGKPLAEEVNCEWYADHKDLMDAEGINAVIIGSPTPFHAQQIKDAAERGLDIFCEKPISTDLNEIDECMKLCEEKGVKLMLGFQRRFDSNFRAIKDQIKAGAIGEVRTFAITSRDPAPPPAEYLKSSGGIFMDMVSHDFDMARFLVGSDVEEIYVQAAAFDPEAQEANDFDTTICSLKFKNGVFGTITNSRRCGFGYDQRVEVFGKEGSLVGENKTPNTVVKSTSDGIVSTLPYDFFMTRYSDAYVNVDTGFVDWCKGGSVEDLMPATAEDGKQCILLGLAAAKSAAEGRPVKLSEITY